ncbi:MAG TPA: murein biosynthesis integral membrane protein MurJ [Candidatus Polarisedimenticolia bacterium]|nr:murein biosynthesis integral membrane protein MurJ [Candidatus Polarisedimenticolia bacterium]
MTTKRQILRSASVVALVTVISRICGYLRDQRVTLLLGTSPAADSLLLAFRIPSMIRRMTAEGSLAASFIPVFTGYLRREPRREAWAFAQKVFWGMAVVLAMVTLLGVLFSPQMIGIFTVLGGSSARWDIAVYLNRIIFPTVLFIGLAAVAAAILNSLQVFALPAATPIFFNLAVIACSFAVVYRPILRWAPEGYRSPAVALAVGILAGGAIQLAMQVPALVRRGMRFSISVSATDPGVRKVARLMGPSFFGMGVYQINLFVDTIFATSSRMPSGSITSLYVADRVMQLVLGSYAIAMSTALLPAMSHQMAAGRWDEMKHTFGFSLRIVSFITLPAAVGLILLRQPIIQVLFQHGQFAAESTLLTARALFYYSLGLPAFAAIKLITPMYYSTQDTMTPARVGAYALGLNVVLNALFLLFFSRTLSNGSPALASSLAAYFDFVALFFVFRRRYGRLGARRVTASLAKMTFCAAAMAAVSYGAPRVLHFASAHHVLEQAGLLAAMILASAAAYFALAWLLRCEELSELSSLLRRTNPAAPAPEGDG